MFIDDNFSKLGEVDVTELVSFVKTISDDIWYADKDRQQRFAAHKQTQTIKLLHDDDFRHQNPTPHKAYTEYKQLIKPCLMGIRSYFNRKAKYARLQKKYGKGYFIRIVIARLDAGGSIALHVDDVPSLARCHRVHMPLLTHEKVDFLVGGSKKNLKTGELWEINNRKPHGVVNASDFPRVHMIMDYVISGEKVKDHGNELVC